MKLVNAERLTDLEYAAAWRLVPALPEGPARWLFEAGAGLVARRRGPGFARLRANLSQVAPGASPAELDALTTAGLRSYARYWYETFRLPAMDPGKVHTATEATGPGLTAMYAALGSGRGVVLALPHSGNWDAAGVWLVATLRGLGLAPEFTTVAQRLRPESLYRRFVGHREALGFEVVAATDGMAAHRALTSRLRGGGVVCLLADRDVTGGGIPVSLLGAPAKLPVGPARLAALTGALLVPIYPSYTPRGWAIAFAEPVPVVDRTAVAAATQAVADALGAFIAAGPTDWHALQPIWLPVPVPVEGPV